MNSFHSATIGMEKTNNSLRYGKFNFDRQLKIYNWECGISNDESTVVTQIIKAAYTAEIFVQEFYISMNDFKSKQLIVFTFNGAAKVETCIPVEWKKNRWFMGRTFIVREYSFW